MPEHIRVYILVSVIATIAFALGRFAVTESIMDPDDYRRRRNIWYLLTSIAFLSHNFWLFMLGTLLLAFFAGRREQNVIALYLMMLITVPGFSQPLPGFGGINFLFVAQHETMIALGLLLPAAIYYYRKGDGRDESLRLPDRFVACLVIWVALRHGMDGSVTEFLREVFYQFVDIALPWYVASRWFRSAERFRDAMAAFVVAAVIVGAIAIFETWRGWLVYQELRYGLGLPAPTYFLYLQRGSLGLMRAQSTLMQPIVVGYVMMFGLAMLSVCSPFIKARLVYYLAMFSIVGGMIASLSRGPWVGAAAMLMVLIALDPSVGRRVSRTIGAALVAMVVLFATPLGSTVIELLPWVGTIEAENIDYRSRLFEVSVEVIRQNPWLGDLAYLSNPLMEEMRQGQNLIDVTNSYLEVALPYGLIGLAAFLAPFTVCLLRLRRALKNAVELPADTERLGRTLLALLVGVMVTIATVSGIGVIPQLYWVLLGMGFSYAIYVETVRREVPSEEATEALLAPGRTRGRKLSEGY